MKNILNTKKQRKPKSGEYGIVKDYKFIDYSGKFIENKINYFKESIELECYILEPKFQIPKEYEFHSFEEPSETSPECIIINHDSLILPDNKRKTTEGKHICVLPITFSENKCLGGIYQENNQLKLTKNLNKDDRNLEVETTRDFKIRDQICIYNLKTKQSIIREIDILGDVSIVLNNKPDFSEDKSNIIIFKLQFHSVSHITQRVINIYIEKAIFRLTK